jgi:hypothetical protein
MEKIQWYLVGNKVGESDLPNHSTKEIRQDLAFKAGVKEFDNFIFLKANGDFRLSANEILFENKETNSFDRLGNLEGTQYQLIYPNGLAIH